jgi:putative ABC transport system permease protein
LTTSEVGLKIISLEPREFITIGGMIIGNAMNIASLAISNFRDNALLRIAEIEGYTALGADLSNALKNSIRVSVKLALTPVINNLQTVGIVLIPGIMSGMILAGASPLKAVSYQLVIMYMILAVSLLASVFAIRLSYRKILESPLSN